VRRLHWRAVDFCSNGHLQRFAEKPVQHLNSGAHIAVFGGREERIERRIQLREQSALDTVACGC